MRRWPYRLWLLVVVLLALIAGCIRPVAPTDLVYEHIPTVIALGLLVWTGTRHAFSDRSYTLLAAFFLLHILGAHYLYSNVPYDEWARRLFGTGPDAIFGWKRNCYDRLVHLSFGLLVAPVVYEMGVRFAGMRPGVWPALLAIGVVSICGNMYEVLEWLIAATMSQADAENYNGQQGDVWDPQKDLALSFIGSVFAAGVCVLVDRVRGPAFDGAGGR